MDAWLFKKKYKADYLTQDIFFPCINRDKISGKSEKEKVVWKELGINGYEDFSVLSQFALRYNRKTAEEINERIKSLNLPKEYISVQIRKGDKSIEFKNLMPAKAVAEAFDKYNINNNNLFVVADDYSSIIELKELKPELKIYTLTKESEKGYNNVEFQKREWNEKRGDMLKLFTMVEICLKSQIHLGNNQSNLNSFIKSAKKDYIEIWDDQEQAGKWIVYK